MLILLVAGCGTATLYGPQNLDGGYASTRLGSDTFNVVFQGNAHTPWKTAESYALYRSAELTVESGFDYFVVVGGPPGASTLGQGAGNPVPPAADSDTDHPIVSLVIRAFPGPKPSPQAINARDLLQELGPTVKRR